jgi:hypothetical protein
MARTWSPVRNPAIAAGSLLEIDYAEDDRRQGRQRKDCRSQPDPKTIVKWSTQLLFPQELDGAKYRAT